MGRLSRNLSINRALHDKARKRGGGEVTAALEELREIGGGSAEEAVEQAELGRLIDRFLRTLPEKECSIFLRRYWFLDSVEEIARRYGLRGGSVKTRLHRTRKKTQRVSETGGICTMKHIDETMLLLAGQCGRRSGGSRGEAQRTLPPARFLHFAALAACLCLIVGVAVPYVMDGFGSGNNAGCIGDISDKNAPETVCENGALPGDSAEKMLL